MIVSYELLHELETVLLRDWFRRKLTVSDVLEYVLWLREGATLAVNPARTTVEEGVSSDPDDDYLYALSLENLQRTWSPVIRTSSSWVSPARGSRLLTA